MPYGIGYPKISHSHYIFIVFLISWFFIPYFNGDCLLRSNHKYAEVHCSQYNFTITVREEPIDYQIIKLSYLNKRPVRPNVVKLNVTEFTKELMCVGYNKNTSYSYKKRVITPDESERDDFNQPGLSYRWNYADTVFLPMDYSCPVDEHFLSSVPCTVIPKHYYVFRYAIGPLFAYHFSFLVTICIFFISDILGLQLIDDDDEDDITQYIEDNHIQISIDDENK